jgi:hypothetical protein
MLQTVCYLLLYMYYSTSRTWIGTLFVICCYITALPGHGSAHCLLFVVILQHFQDMDWHTVIYCYITALPGHGSAHCLLFVVLLQHFQDMDRHTVCFLLLYYSTSRTWIGTLFVICCYITALPGHGSAQDRQDE